MELQAIFSRLKRFCYGLACVEVMFIRARSKDGTPGQKYFGPGLALM